MRVLCEHVFERFKDMTVYSHAGRITHVTFGYFTDSLTESTISETSLSPFDLEELSNMLTLLDQMKGQFHNHNIL